jgi:hypothetical protein
VALTKFNYNSFDLTTAASKGLAFNSSANGFETAAEGSMTLIKTLTASSDSTLSFVHGTSDVVLDSTYPVYLFKFINIHQSQTSFASFNVGFRDGGSAYDAIKTTTKFEVYHTEADATSFAYSSGDDLANSTSFQRLGLPGYNNDESMVGEMFLFAPSNTTFTKHFISRSSLMEQDSTPYAFQCYNAGYCNVTAAIDGVSFSFSSGNIDSGVIKMYGLSKS